MRRILSRHQGRPMETYWGICIRWPNAEGGVKDKQMGDFILTMDPGSSHVKKGLVPEKL